MKVTFERLRKETEWKFKHVTEMHTVYSGFVGGRAPKEEVESARLPEGKSWDVMLRGRMLVVFAMLDESFTYGCGRPHGETVRESISLLVSSMI